MEITREDLYAAVWREPMTRLAPGYGLSQFALASLCRKLQVPTPPVGHWSKLAHGKASPQPPLLPLKEEIPKEALQRGRPVRQQTPMAAPAPVAIPPTPEPPTPQPKQEPPKVPERLTNPHPVVRATADAMVGAERDSYGMIRPRRLPAYPSDPVPLDLHVSPAQKMRALRFVDTLAKALAARGYEFDKGKHEDRARGQYGARPSPIIGGHHVPFLIEEKSDRYPHVPTAAERAAAKRETWRTLPTWDYVPSGKLSVKIDVGVYWTDSLRKRWSDRQSTTIEDSLDEIIAGMIEVGEALRRRAEQEAREAAERQERERLRQEEEKRRKIEAARREDLEARAEAWGRAATLRRFITAIEARLRDEPEGGSSEAKEWLTWASAHAERLDPLARGIDVLIRDVEDAGQKAVEPAYPWLART